MHTGATTDSTINQSEESVTMSPAVSQTMDLMNQMGMGPMLSAFTNAAGLLIVYMYIRT